LSNTDLCPKVKSVRSTRERYAMALVIAGIALIVGPLRHVSLVPILLQKSVEGFREQ
jgi:hypothetical protein